jgi:putative transposase
VSYAYYFNKKYSRVGHIFQDRYRSESIENDAYLLSVIRYIHNNPVKAVITKRSEDYAWSSYNKYLNPSEPDEIVETQTILSMFSDDEHTALKNFIKFSTEPTNEEFMDINNNLEIPEKPVENKKLIVEQLLKANGCKLREVKTLKDKERRNELLRIIKQRSLISSRELSKILGISKDIIFRS